MRLLFAAVLWAALVLAGASCAEEPNFEEATRAKVEALAEAGDPEALTALGQMYEKGLTVERDLARAHELYLAASEKGDALAPFRLGELYARGEGVGRDHAAAANWYRLAGERGNAAALAALAQLYEEGLGVARDYREAARLYERAAELWQAGGAFPADTPYASAQDTVLLTPPSAQSARSQQAMGEPLAQAMPPAEVAAATSAAPPEPPAQASGARACPEPELSSGFAPAFHLASFRKAENAAREWRRLCARDPALLEGLSPRIVRVELPGLGVYHRLLAGPVGEEAQARERCRAFEAGGYYCRVLARL